MTNLLLCNQKEVDVLKHEYELISHNNVNFHVFLVNILYRTPHVHRDYEICLILDGTITLYTNNETFILTQNDIFITNPFSIHELKAESPALILSLQISPSLFSAYYPQIKHTQVDISVLNSQTHETWCETIRKNILQIALSYFHKEKLYEFKCVTLLNQLFQFLLATLPTHLVSENERISAKFKAKRMQNIAEYIDEHFSEKLLLSDIAKQLELDLFYLSHFFKDCFGMSFQNYLKKIRCEHARQLLLLSDLSMLNISISCGFSDPKYFNKAFLQQYGCLPKQYRKNFKTEKLEEQQKSMLSTQEFLSESSSLNILDKYMMG